MKLRKGNVFTPVSQSFCSHGGVRGRRHSWQGDMHGGGCMHGRGHVWWRACMAGDIHSRGVAYVAEGMRGGGCARRGSGVAGETATAADVRILLECILVYNMASHNENVQVETFLFGSFV